ncbi:MAG: gamma subclass chorismate mutase AroQ [Comamonadaceae bacterium]|nr:MAG: gamma subclass chorismate mutase AroQ [Comamonadaceae bacterium]
MSALSTPLAALCVRSIALVLLTTSALATKAQVSQTDGFGALIALADARLEISRQVALIKWDTREPVADPPGDPREQKVLDAAAAEATKMGLPIDTATAFFGDQIEASKLIQYALMAEWSRAGVVPAGGRADLKAELRPALDGLRPRFIEAMLATRAIRFSDACASQLARETADYVEAHGAGPLDSIGLTRGLARVCAR